MLYFLPEMTYGEESVAPTYIILHKLSTNRTNQFTNSEERLSKVSYSTTTTTTTTNTNNDPHPPPTVTRTPCWNTMQVLYRTALLCWSLQADCRTRIVRVPSFSSDPLQVHLKQRTPLPKVSLIQLGST